MQEVAHDNAIITISFIDDLTVAIVMLHITALKSFLALHIKHVLEN